MSSASGLSDNFWQTLPVSPQVWLLVSSHSLMEKTVPKFCPLPQIAHLKSENIGPLPIFSTLKHVEYRVSVCICYESSPLDINISSLFSSGDKEKKILWGQKIFSC